MVTKKELNERFEEAKPHWTDATTGDSLFIAKVLFDIKEELKKLNKNLSQFER